MDGKEILSAIKSPLDKIVNLIAVEFRQFVSNRIIEYQVEEYKRNYFSKTMLHRIDPIPLKDFYQPLFIQKQARQGQRLWTSSAKKLFGKISYITLIGSAGSGKSTIVKYLYTNCFEEKYKIPIKLELRYLNDYNGNIHEFICEKIFKYQKIGITEEIVDRLLSSDNFIFFLDGYDEINSSIRAKSTKDIDNLIMRYPNNKYLITSRPFTNIDLMPLFSNYQVCNLDDEEIQAFVRKQIPVDENELAEKIIGAIGKTENSSYRSFLSNPLLLSMFILTFQSYSEIPQLRSEFYNQVFDTLFSLHDSISKLSYSRERVSKLSKDQFQEVLRVFSFISFSEEKFIFTSTYLNKKLNLIKEKKKNIEFDNELAINDLQIAIGILNKEGLDYTFPHRSLQEFFAASYISKLANENKIITYDKFKSEILKNNFSLLNKLHFYSLLSEMDYRSVVYYLAIPLLEHLYNKIQPFEITDETSYKFWGMLLLIKDCLINSRNRMVEINEILKCNSPYVFYRFGNNEFELPKEFRDGKMVGKLDFVQLKDSISKFKGNGMFIINKIKKEMEEIDKSDQEIIDLYL